MVITCGEETLLIDKRWLLERSAQLRNPQQTMMVDNVLDLTVYLGTKSPLSFIEFIQYGRGGSIDNFAASRTLGIEMDYKQALRVFFRNNSVTRFTVSEILLLYSINNTMRFITFFALFYFTEMEDRRQLPELMLLQMEIYSRKHARSLYNIRKERFPNTPRIDWAPRYIDKYDTRRGIWVNRGRVLERKRSVYVIDNNWMHVLYDNESSFTGDRVPMTTGNFTFACGDDVVTLSLHEQMMWGFVNGLYEVAIRLDPMINPLYIVTNESHRLYIVAIEGIYMTTTRFPCRKKDLSITMRCKRLSSFHDKTDSCTEICPIKYLNREYLCVFESVFNIFYIINSTTDELSYQTRFDNSSVVFDEVCINGTTHLFALDRQNEKTLTYDFPGHQFMPCECLVVHATQTHSDRFHFKQSTKVINRHVDCDN